MMSLLRQQKNFKTYTILKMAKKSKKFRALQRFYNFYWLFHFPLFSEKNQNKRKL